MVLMTRLVIFFKTDSDAWFTIVPLKPLTDQSCEESVVALGYKMFMSDHFYMFFSAVEMHTSDL